MEDARKKGCDKPRGYLLNADRNGSHSSASAGGQAKAADAKTPTKLLIRASSVETRAVEWLWPGRVPLGKMTTFAGLGGLGKTFVLCDITARVTTGTAWPDGEANGIPGDVVVSSAHLAEECGPCGSGERARRASC